MKFDPGSERLSISGSGFCVLDFLDAVRLPAMLQKM
jgi:hypothetical protein